MILTICGLNDQTILCIACIFNELALYYFQLTRRGINLEDIILVATGNAVSDATTIACIYISGRNLEKKIIWGISLDFIAGINNL